MWQKMLARLVFIVVALAAPATNSSVPPILLPIEIMGLDGTVVSVPFDLNAIESQSARSLWLQVHGLRYSDQASVQIGSSEWIPLNNKTAAVAAPARSFGGIGGAFATLTMTVPLPSGALLAGPNILRFRFNHTDGLASGFRVLSFNFLTSTGTRLLPSSDFAEDNPDNWTPPLPDATSIRAGQELWRSAPLVASSLPNSPAIRARCADCHSLDGRDLKYFNFSNHSIVTRSAFHGLSALEGEQIASYIRSLALPHPGRPWNPPYQPGPGQDSQPVANWAAGAGLRWVLDRDVDALPYLFSQRASNSNAVTTPPQPVDLSSLLPKISSDVFRPDGDLNPREIPIALQLPDWEQWLPRIHPKDAWGDAFEKSKFAALYDASPETKSNPSHKSSLRAILDTNSAANSEIASLVPGFARWSQARQAFLGQFVTSKTVWSPQLTNKVYSTQLWQLVKTWELMQEFGLENRGPQLVGAADVSRTWCNSVPEETAPAATHIPNGPASVESSPLINEYLSASWYELQVLVNAGTHRRRDRSPVYWPYHIREFESLYRETNYPEPVRLIVAVTKALESSDPRFGPGNLSQGWRPDQNVDPRVMVSRDWLPIFAPLPPPVHRALTESLLIAWMDKVQQYPLSEYLPLQPDLENYGPHYTFGDFSGGEVWRATSQFRALGVSADIIDRVYDWGVAYTDRSARIQYHH
jgi:hypothetical protein